jgi:hypothetical protein
MPEINNSFQCVAPRETLEAFLEELHDNIFTEADIDNYDEEFTSDNTLLFYFDGFGRLAQYVNKVKKFAKKRKVDFDCTLIVDWSLHGDYHLFTYRQEKDTLSQFTLLPEHKAEVKELDDEQYEFLGKTYHSSDVPGVLGGIMMDHFYGEQIHPLN